MAKRGGFPGGMPGNMANIMKQAQKMQKQMEEAQKNLVDPDDIEMLEDLIMAATNEAMRKIDEASQQSMSQITGALGGGLPF